MLLVGLQHAICLCCFVVYTIAAIFEQYYCTARPLSQFLQDTSNISSSPTLYSGFYWNEFAIIPLCTILLLPHISSSLVCPNLHSGQICANELSPPVDPAVVLCDAFSNQIDIVTLGDRWHALLHREQQNRWT